MQRIASGQFELRNASEVRPAEQSNGGAGDGRSNLMQRIASGQFELRKVSEVRPAEQRPAPHGGLAAQIALAMAARRNAAQLEDGDDDDSDEDW